MRARIFNLNNLEKIVRGSDDYKDILDFEDKRIRTSLNYFLDTKNKKFPQTKEEFTRYATYCNLPNGTPGEFCMGDNTIAVLTGEPRVASGNSGYDFWASCSIFVYYKIPERDIWVGAGGCSVATVGMPATKDELNKSSYLAKKVFHQLANNFTRENAVDFVQNHKN